MSLFLVDSHCHLDRLDLKPFGGKLEGALQNAADHGVGHFLCVCIDLDHFNDVLKPAKQHANISASVGVHPNEKTDKEPNIEELVKLAADEDVVAIGETGLDYYRSEGDLEWQRDRFRTHIAAARQTQKPLIIHMRDAAEDTLRILKEEGADEVGGVMHCFTEDRAIAKRALDLNFMISFSGIVTFNSAVELKEVAKVVPADRMLVETDSPYLAPVPFRGKSNQPAYVRHVAAHLAELRKTGLEDIAEQTTKNYFALFGGNKSPG
ncbi:MAG: TatD family hydrolase [Gammaproteobacteria bacterium]|nr:TatD family hydrolase [Gammaproteobacteria bacterium]MDH5652686.1 TatD family hydrolase [Gammaproteobacteria bacterium]